MSKRGLGKGLGELFQIPEVEVEKERDSILEIEIKRVEANPRQPRKEFHPEKLAELAASIREHGVVQPIVVRPAGEGYEIVAGERRWRAAKLAGLERVPALVRDFKDSEAMEIALIENLQREDLNPLEEAEAYQLLLSEYGLTQEALAQRLGRSRPQISNTLRLLQLATEVQAEVRGGRLSMGHAKVLLSITDRLLQARVGREAAEKGLSVRELEGLVKRALEPTAPRERVALPPNLLDVESRLREWFGTPVKLQTGSRKGTIEITYFGEEGLARILEVLGFTRGEERRASPPKTQFRV